MKRPSVRAVLAITLLLGTFSGATINNIAAAPLSLIAHDFGTAPAEITIVAGASGFALACCMPLAGWMGVRWGSRHILMVAFTLLGAGCLLASLAPTVGVLVMARLVQGIAMSIVPPTVMHALPLAVQSGGRARALGWWAVANGAGTAAGAPLGAVVADAFGWRATFLMFVPVCAILAALCSGLAADSDRQRPLDVSNALLLTFSLVFLIAPIMSVNTGVPGWIMYSAACAGVTAGLVFIMRIKKSAAPFVSAQFLRSRGFITGTLGGTSQMFILGSSSVLIPILVIHKFGYSVQIGGALVLVITLVMMAAAPPVSAVVPRFGADRVVSGGLGLATVALLAVGFAIVHLESLWPPVVCLIMVGAALGLLQSPSAITVSGENASRGVGVGIYNSIRFAGGVAGIGWLSSMSVVGASAETAFQLTALPVGIAWFTMLALHFSDKPRRFARRKVV